MNYLAAAISLGFLGSFHCIGMCGPIALALPINNQSTISKLISSLLYNFGRAITYSIFGFIFGALGQSFVIGGYQQGLSIVLGSIILLVIILPKFVFSKFKLTNPLLLFSNQLSKKMGYLFNQKTYSSLLVIGLLNGLLPCGLVYMGIAGAIATGDMWNGALFMFVFGIGTFPIMATLILTGSNISIGIRNKIRKSVPLFISIMGILLILRGMNLGIPYISPELSKEKCEAKSCCKH